MACGTAKNATSEKNDCFPAMNLEEFEAVKSRIDSTNAETTIGSFTYYDHYAEVVVSYSGGCEKHDFYLVQVESKDNYHTYDLIHDSNGDNCREWIEDTLCFDISPLNKDSGDKIWINGFFGEK
jgi:hypothetical protein